MAEGWPRAGERIRTARTRAGYRTTQEFADATGLSYGTINDLETGRRGTFTHRVLDRVEAELGWAEGSILRIVEGRREVRYDSELRQLQDMWPRLNSQARAMLLRLAREAAGGD